MNDKDNKIEILPPTELFFECIATRDFSRFDVLEDDSDEQKQEKARGRQEIEQIMDMYTDKLITAIAGPTMFHPKVRHFEPMTTASLPPVKGLGTQLRIPASTEAMAIMTYANNRTKWQSMVTWKKTHPNMKLPRYNSKNPTVHAEFKEEYSSSNGKQNNWGGWSSEGRQLFLALQKKIHESRKDNRDRHIKIDEECVARLFEKYKEMHGDMGTRANKKQKVDQDIADRDVDWSFIIED
jgi:hypothetical protein